MDEAASPPLQRQTQSYLRGLFRERGLRPKNKLGQNFLADLNLLDFIARQAELTRADMVLEVGTGTASLTSILADLAGAVLSIEIDPAFHDLAGETVGQRAHVQLLRADILKNKNHLSAEVLAKLSEGWLRFQAKDGPEDSARPKRLKLVANLPYAVAVPVLSNLLLTDLPFERMVVTVQWEIAERLSARPGTKAYGALAILVQSGANVEILRRLPPAVFWPRPKVASAIVRIRPNSRKRAAAPDLARLRNFLRDLYSHRRKNLRGGLLGMSGQKWEKHQVDEKLAELGLDGTVRAETLDINDHHRLCEMFG